MSTTKINEDDLITSSDEIIMDSSKILKNIKSSGSEEDEFTEYCNEALVTLKANYIQEKNHIKQMMKLHKQSLKTNKKNKYEKKSTTKTGFTKSEPVPDSLAKLVGVTPGTTMSRTDVTKKVYDAIKDRKLYYEKDKRVLRTDEEIQQIFDLPDSVNQSINPKDKEGFNFFNIQKHISQVYQKDKNKKINIVEILD